MSYHNTARRFYLCGIVIRLDICGHQAILPSSYAGILGDIHRNQAVKRPLETME